MAPTAIIIEGSFFSVTCIFVSSWLSSDKMDSSGFTRNAYINAASH